jgi:hypothetical protein
MIGYQTFALFRLKTRKSGEFARDLPDARELLLLIQALELTGCHARDTGISARLVAFVLP